MHVGAFAGVHPFDDLGNRGLELGGRQVSVVDHLDPGLGDLGLGQGGLHRGALAGLVLVVLYEVEHAADAEAAEHLHIAGVERIGADEQPVAHIGEAVGSEPL